MPANEVRQKSVTLEDIAKLAGVHRRTVRDAIQGTGRVAAATRENVLRITRELNYVPNASARALATGRTGRVAILSGSLKQPYNSNAVHLLESHLSRHGLETMLVQSVTREERNANTIKASQSDGVIALGVQQLNDEVKPGDAIPPWVLIDTSTPDYIDHITLDFRPAVEEAFNLMMASKRQRIAYVAHNYVPGSPPEVRRSTYLELMNEAGRPPEIISMLTNLEPAECIAVIKSYFRENGCPDALICQNDETAVYVYHALVSLGVQIPEEAMLVGCDGLPLIEYLDTPLSTIAVPMEEICEIAFQFLQNRMATPELPVQERIIIGHLTIRKSLLAE
jgi:DNA-binding LacI/PurR family transcriptional regulator